MSARYLLLLYYYTDAGGAPGPVSVTGVRSPWPARWGILERPFVSRWPLAGTASFSAGDFVHKDGTSIVEAINDTTSVFALAAEGSSQAVEPGFVMVYELRASHWIGMMGTRAPLASDVGVSYGVAQNQDGVWVVNFDDTTSTRVIVQDVDTYQNYVYVTYIDTYIQS